MHQRHQKKTTTTTKTLTSPPRSETTKAICSRLAMVTSMPAGQRLRALIKGCSFSRRSGLLKTRPAEFSSLTCYSSGRAGKRRLLQVALQQQNIFIPCFWTGKTKRWEGEGYRVGGGGGMRFPSSSSRQHDYAAQCFLLNVDQWSYFPTWSCGKS